MTFDPLIYIGRLKEAGVAEPVARAHAEALRDALLETVATKADIKDVRTDLREGLATLDRRVEITARDLTIRGAGGLIIIATLIVGLKLFG